MQYLLRPGWVFVLDDDEVARKHAEACLRRQGWRVHLFADANSFVEAMLVQPPEAALVDIFLPQGAGTTIVSRLRRNSRTSRMRVVAYTATSHDDRELLMHSGFDEVLSKPGLPQDFERLLPAPEAVPD
ncbi:MULTISPECIES: response regulator [Ramlibacter]|uniref:Response regulator n=1 Tax=Ramlibacter aquaticus TaxID=2780094 RepID=A0ABR9SIG6_9BURK|nr:MULTISPECIES: response regulator [Ramlibacter]MBE7942065.1 response regulator [Ramlibacter aquaticus]